MSGDLEEFLKRAAQRRRERAAQQQAQQPKPRQRPEYTDRRAERAAYAQYDQEIDDAPLMAEIVPDEDAIAPVAQPPQPVESQPPKTQRPKSPERESGKDAPRAAGLPQPEITPEELMAWLREPAGLKQAILIREILDRPTHRWD